MDIVRHRMANFLEVDPHDEPLGAYDLTCDLKPRSWGTTEVEDAVSGLQEVFGILDLQEFVRRPGQVALSFGVFEVAVMERSSGHFFGIDWAAMKIRSA